MKKFVYIILLAVVFLSCTLHVVADEWLAPMPFEIISEDGDKIFRFDPDSADGTSTYSTADVYQNTEPPKLVYTVENLRSWAYESCFFFSEDFQNFAFLPSPDMDTAIEFYSEGQLVKTYSIKELVKNRSKITYSTSSAWWKNSEAEVSLDQDRLTITTVDDLTYVFDITTGDIIEKSGTSSINLTHIFNIGVVAIVIVVFIMFLRNRRRPS